MYTLLRSVIYPTIPWVPVRTETAMPSDDVRGCHGERDDGEGGCGRGGRDLREDRVHGGQSSSDDPRDRIDRSRSGETLRESEGNGEWAPRGDLEGMRRELRDAEARLHQLRDEVEREERAEAEEDARYEAEKAQRQLELSAPPPPPPPPPPRPVRPLGTFSLLLVKHAACETAPQNRSVDEASTRLRRVREKITSASDFNKKAPPKPKEVLKRFTDLARLQSDCPISARKGGALGQVVTGQLPVELEEEAIALDVGQVSREVQSSEGCGILLRTA